MGDPGVIVWMMLQKYNMILGKTQCSELCLEDRLPKACPGSHLSQCEIWHGLFGRCEFGPLCCVNPYIYPFNRQIQVYTTGKFGNNFNL